MSGKNPETIREAKLRRYKRKRIIQGLLVAAVVIFIAFFVFRSASFQRGFKTFRSNYSGGLDRTITVYDNHGNEIKKYQTKTDIEDNENKILFDTAEGKRIIIYNAVVVAEEN